MRFSYMAMPSLTKSKVVLPTVIRVIFMQYASLAHKCSKIYTTIGLNFAIV